MKKKLDLNNLLAKYEGMSGPQIVEYQSPVAHYQSRSTPIQQQFYQTDNYQRQYQTSSQPVTGNFQMSKSECEQFLVRVKEELRNEERGLTHYAQNATRHVHERFQANHQKIKREILELLERAFQQNQRCIREQLKRQGHEEPVEFSSVHKKISYFDEEINRLLYGLKGHQYRKSIAEVVMKDFNVEMSELKETIKMAKQNYLSTLGQVEPDREKIECIKRDLQQLFRISKKNANLVQKSLFSVIQDKFNENGRVSATVEPQQQHPPPPAKQKTRKSFFNFGSD